jgi:hypothetical protein
VTAPCTTADGPHVGYQRRRPERSVLYRIVSQHIETLWAEAEASSPDSVGYPAYVKHEFERFLSCGQLPGGFTRLRCRGCGCDRLVAFSCKGRSLCPSCVSRRMADAALHLTDNVLPKAPYRQWTLTFPYPLRLALVRDPQRLSQVLSDFLRTVFTWQRLQARRAGIKARLTGAITAVQFWGSLLQLTPHFHSFVPDGVFGWAPDGSLVFHRLPPPDDRDVARLCQRIAKRVLARFDADDEFAPDDDDDALAVCCAQSLQLPAVTLAPSALPPQRPLCAQHEGFSLHADLSVHACDRAGLQRVLRYGLRPPLSQKRLSLTPAGKVRLALRKPLGTGQTHLEFEPVSFLRRLAASIPRPRQNMLRFHGVFAPKAAARGALTALVPKPKALTLPTLNPSSSAATSPSQHGPPADPRPPVPVPYRRPWAELLKRVLDQDALRCPRCHQRMVPIQTVKDPVVIRKILSHLGLPTELPIPAAARAPPQQAFDFDAAAQDELFELPFDA